MMKTRPARLRVGLDGFIHVRRPGKGYTKRKRCLCDYVIANTEGWVVRNIFLCGNFS